MIVPKIPQDPATSVGRRQLDQDSLIRATSPRIPRYILSHEISIAAWKKNDLELGRCHVLCSRFTMVCGVPFIQGYRLPRLGSLQQVKIGAKLNDIISA